MTQQIALYMPVEVGLTDTEKSRLIECEAIIERGIKTFVDVGNALLEIRDNRYYRQEYDTFEDYCRNKWGWERRHAYRLIDAATAFENVSHGTQTGTMFLDNPATWPANFKLPDSERVARPLTSLEPEEQREAWKRAVDTAPDGKITAAHVQSVVDEIKDKPHVSFNSGNNEWYTPREYIEAARRVMGEIDLDPASSLKANDVVRAIKYYTAANNGLTKDWKGRVWMNPPYSSDLIGEFISKLVGHFANGEVSEAIVLVNNATETSWFQTLLEVSAAVCFPRRRIKFVDVLGNPIGAPLQGQSFLYLGENSAIFDREFSQFGVVLYGR